MTNQPASPSADLQTELLQQLVDRVGQLLDQGSTVVPVVAALERSLVRRTRAFWAAVVIGAVLVLALGGVALDNRAQIASLKRQFCPVVEASITRPGAAAPVTQHGRDVETAMRKLAGTFGCAGVR